MGPQWEQLRYDLGLSQGFAIDALAIKFYLHSFHLLGGHAQPPFFLRLRRLHGIITVLSVRRVLRCPVREQVSAKMLTHAARSIAHARAMYGYAYAAQHNSGYGRELTHFVPSFADHASVFVSKDLPPRASCRRDSRGSWATISLTGNATTSPPQPKAARPPLR